MKRLFLIILVLFMFIGCEDYSLDWENDEDYTTFEEVSDPYLEMYGEPEDKYSYYSSDYDSVDWWWWSQGVNITFVNSTYDDIYGWYVDSRYYFDPI